MYLSSAIGFYIGWNIIDFYRALRNSYWNWYEPIVLWVLIAVNCFIIVIAIHISIVWIGFIISYTLFLIELSFQIVIKQYSVRGNANGLD